MPIASICIYLLARPFVLVQLFISGLQIPSRTLSSRFRGGVLARAYFLLFPLPLPLFVFSPPFYFCAKGLETGTRCSQEVRFAISGSSTCPGLRFKAHRQATPVCWHGRVHSARFGCVYFSSRFRLSGFRLSTGGCLGSFLFSVLLAPLLLEP